MSGAYTRPGDSARRNAAQARRERLERRAALRRVDAVAAPHAIAMRARLGAIVVLFLLGWGAILARAGWLALAPDDRLSGRLTGQHERLVDVAAQRGTIVDRLGRPLAISVEQHSVYADPQLIEDPAATADLLAGELELPRAELLELLSKPRRFVWLQRQVPPHTSEAIEALDLPGVRLAAEPHRDYPAGQLAAQILGFVGVDGQGLEGLEARFDSVLMGDSFQYRLLRDGRRRTVNHDAVLGRRSTEGDTLVLTLDHSLQHRAEHSLAQAIETHDAEGGMVVTLDLETGGILALASLPTFDPNDFGGVDRSLFRHSALSTVFEPGSTMKPFVMAEVLDRGLASRDETIYCERGAYRLGRRTVHDAHPHADLSFDEVLKFSSNIGLTKLGERLGPAELEATYRRYGFGRKTGVDLYGEESGILHASSSWSRIGLATHTFGQGMAVTGIQLATAMAGLVNGGHPVQPHLVSRVVDLDGEVVEDRRPKPSQESLVSEATSRDLREMMAGVMEEGGTGVRARLDEYSCGGKTGTAQKVRDGRYAPGVYVSSFIGFAPLDEPRVLTLVVLDEPKNKHYGGTVAGPVFKDVTTYALRELGVAPDRPRPLEPVVVDEEAEERELPVLDLDAEAPAMPDLVGLSARDAVQVLAGLPVELNGSGLVSSQVPEAGTPLIGDTTVRLALSRRDQAKN